MSFNFEDFWPGAAIKKAAKSAEKRQAEAERRAFLSNNHWFYIMDVEHDRDRDRDVLGKYSFRLSCYGLESDTCCKIPVDVDRETYYKYRSETLVTFATSKPSNEKVFRRLNKRALIVEKFDDFMDVCLLKCYGEVSKTTEIIRTTRKDFDTVGIGDVIDIEYKITKKR